jgi:NADPH:quinone reductase-like Zn-dependent oxidoreductase
LTPVPLVAAHKTDGATSRPRGIGTSCRTSASVPARNAKSEQAVSDGTATVPIGKVYTLDDIVQAHTDMEESRASGKLVVTT